MKTPANGAGAALPIPNPNEGEKKSINAELWQSCAGPLVNLPAARTHVVYFPQGHSEQVAASMKMDVDAQIPNYPNLPSKLLCLLHNVTLHADPETDEVYAQMTLQPVPSFDKEGLLRSDLSMKGNRPQTEFFCKTLTASDTSTHGGFSVPRRAAEKIFPPLDFSMQPPAQELVARDLHDNVWTFRHIFRGQPKRHLLTTGWSLFVSGKRLFAGDSVLFIRDEKQQLLLGIRRANRQPTNLSSSVLTSDSMHIGILAAAAHAAANNSPFTVFYNPRASPSEFVIPLAKYYKAVCSSQISLGMRFRMMFETEESGTRRYMGTITGISDLDPARWKNSQWRNLQVGWDESTAGERRNRVSVWEIEPVTAPFFICPTPPFFRSKRPRQPGMPDDESSDLDNFFKRTMPWLSEDPQALPGLSLAQWMNMQQNPSLSNPIPQNYLSSFSGSILPSFSATELSRQFGLPVAQVPAQNTIQFNTQRPTPQTQESNSLPKLPQSALNSPLNPLASVIQPQQQLNDFCAQPVRQNATLNQTLVANPVQVQQNLGQPQSIVLQQQTSNNFQNQQLQRRFSQTVSPQQQLAMGGSQSQPQNLILTDQQVNSQQQQVMHMNENQIQMQLLQMIHQQQQSLLSHQSALQHQLKPPVEVSPSFSRSISTTQSQELPQTTIQSQNASPQVMARNNSQPNPQFSNLTPLQKFQVPPAMVSDYQGQLGPAQIPMINQLSAGGSSLLTGAANGGQSGITDDIPSCSTSPSTNNCPNVIQSTINCSSHRNAIVADEITQSSAYILSCGGLETVPANVNFIKSTEQKSDVKPSVNISKTHQNRGFLAPQTYLSPTVGTQLDYLDSSSSATSVCLSQSNVNFRQNANPFNTQQLNFHNATQDGEIGDDSRENVAYGANMDSQLGVSVMSDPLIGKGMKDFSSNVSSGGVILGYENAHDPQPELSSSMVSQSFGVPDMTFNSIDSTISGSGLLNRGSWAPAPPYQRMRTYTKVYKRGAVGRSIDITAYSGYEELKQDLARRFGIEGQLEDRTRVGWKLVYVDHENDVLLVGDDPWEEFVNCVRCIKILSPQEVQQLSLDFGNSVLPNQACSSSDNGNV